jgi:hypothetical protein
MRMAGENSEQKCSPVENPVNESSVRHRPRGDRYGTGRTCPVDGEQQHPARLAKRSGGVETMTMLTAQ